MDNFGTYLLDLLGQLGGGRGDPANELTRFTLSAIFWATLWISAFRAHKWQPHPRELMLLAGFAAGFLHAFFMLTVKSLNLYGVVSEASLEMFVPPIDHVLTLLVRIVIAAAFMLYLFESKILAYRYIAIGSLLSIALYIVIAPLWWTTVQTAEPGIKFSHVWMDFADHGLGAVLSVTAIALFYRTSGWVCTAISLVFAMFLLDDLLMLINLATGEIYKAALTPVRHNLQLWAIPLFGYIYWQEQREENERLLAQQQQSWRLKVVGKLASGVAHDFNNHLQVILGLSELAKLQTDKPEALHKSLDQIGITSEQATTLVKQLLSFSRRPNKQQWEDIQLNELIIELTPILSVLCGDDIIIKHNLDPLLPSVSAERSALEQLVIDLAVNARDAMPDGGALTFSTEAVHRTDHNVSRKKHPGSYARLIISDTGTGMNSESLNRAFDPFFTTKPFGEGTGLGLTQSHHAVLKYGGQIEIESEIDQGTTFTIELPANNSKH